MPTQAYTYAGFETDTSVDKQKPGRGRRATNVRVLRGFLKAAWGNTLVSIELPTGDNRAVDGISDTVGNALVWLVWNSLGQHSIVRHDLTTLASTIVLTWSGLKLPKKRGVTQGDVLDKFLVYLDVNGQVRFINLTRALAGEYTPALLAADPLALHLVKPIPGRRMHLFLHEPVPGDVRASVQNIGDKVHQFAERWRYRDGEETPLGSFSHQLYSSSIDGSNAIEIMWSGRPLPDLVESVDVCYRENYDRAWRVAATLRRDASGVMPTRYNFFGNTFVSVLPTKTGDKTNEYLPKSVRALGIGGNRIFTGWAKEGYNQTAPALQMLAAQPPVLGTLATPLYEVVRNDSYTYTNVTGVTQTINRALILYYGLVSGVYPDTNSRYLLYGYDTPHPLVTGPVTPPGGGHVRDYDGTGTPPVRQRYTVDGIPVTYAQAFLSDVNQTIVSVTVRAPAIAIGSVLGQTVSASSFLHERSIYQGAIEFYDAQGRPMAATSVREIAVAARGTTNLTPKLVQWALPTTNPVALNDEIPPLADTYCLLMSRNKSCSYFFQGRTADVLGYTGDLANGDPKLVILATLDAASGPNLGRYNTNIMWLDVNNLVAQNTAFGYGFYPASGFRNRVDRSSDQATAGITTIATTAKSTDNLGYSFQAGSGDRIRLLDFNLDFPLLYQRGGYLAIKWETRFGDMAQLGFTTESARYLRYEVYSPGVTTATDAFYQRSPRYDVLRVDAGLVSEQRRYAVDSGWLPGDTYGQSLAFSIAASADGNTSDVVINSTSGVAYAPPKTTIYIDSSKAAVPLATFIPVETVSPNPVARPEWYDARRTRPAFVINGGAKEITRKTQINFSNTLVLGTLFNGLSEWEPDSVKDVAVEQGGVTALRLAGQTKEDGNVLIALQERGGESLYLGKVPLSSADGSTSVVALSDLVIGGSNPLTGGFGTRHAASVVAVGSYLYFWDGDRAEPCRYARDGVTPLATTYGCVELFRQLARDYATASVSGAYDPSTKEYILFFGPVGKQNVLQSLGVESTGPTPMPSYAVAFSEDHKAFTADYTIRSPDVAVGTAQHLYCWHNGLPWRHEESAPPATFFGEYTAPNVVLEVDPSPGLGKAWTSVSQDADVAWGSVALTTETGSISRLLPEWFDRSSGFWQAPVHCDETTPGMSAIEGLYQGYAFQSTVLLMTITMAATPAHPNPALRTVRVTYDVLNDQFIGPS